MSDSTNEPVSVIALDDFVRRFGQRRHTLMWLLGAGASASAGVPTAWDMIWEFKQKLYVTQRQVSPRRVADLTNSLVRAQLQQHIDELKSLPAEGATNEYAALFETVYPSESDRRSYIADKVGGGKPSFGHIALATLMKADHARVVWTTNFDTMVADACARVFEGTSRLTEIDLDAPVLGREVLSEERWPVQIKLHGDFRSRRLKNTDDELRQQDATMRKLLVDAGGRYGLVIAGYSGRDDSIMDALEEALEGNTPFPAGLFWLNRGTDLPLPRVDALMRKAAEKDVDGGLVSIENFDETLRDLVRPFEDLDKGVLQAMATKQAVRTAAPRVRGEGGSALVRLNALPLVSRPDVCRLVGCSIGGGAQVREAIEAVGADIIAARRNIGVLAFGEDVAVRRVFDPYTIDHFGVHTIEDFGLRFDSQERGLLRQALARALSRSYGLRLEHRGSQDLLSPHDAADTRWEPLASLTDSLEGALPRNPEIRWREGIGIRLDWADDRLWLLIEPRILFDGVTDSTKHLASEFSRQRTVKRFNATLNHLVDFWARQISNEGNLVTALGISAGMDAKFQFGERTAYSRRARG